MLCASIDPKMIYYRKKTIFEDLTVLNWIVYLTSYFRIYPVFIVVYICLICLDQARHVCRGFYSPPKWFSSGTVCFYLSNSCSEKTVLYVSIFFSRETFSLFYKQEKQVNAYVAFLYLYGSYYCCPLIIEHNSVDLYVNIGCYTSHACHKIHTKNDQEHHKSVIYESEFHDYDTPVEELMIVPLLLSNVSIIPNVVILSFFIVHIC